MAKPKEEKVENIKEEDVSIEDLEGKYLGKGIGTTIEFELVKVRKITVTDPKDPKFEFCLSKTDYFYELDTADEKIFSIGAWSLWNAFRKCVNDAIAAKEISCMEGNTYRVVHSAKGKYTVGLVQ